MKHAFLLSASIVESVLKDATVEYLRKYHVQKLSFLTNIDTVDAALCALTALYFLNGSIKTYGDDVEGFIVVPAIEEGQI